jgi:methylenetetrahydrofolate reductase (NADPH)
VHVMAYRQEELVAEIIQEAGLLPRPRQPGLPPRETTRSRQRRTESTSSGQNS